MKASVSQPSTCREAEWLPTVLAQKRPHPKSSLPGSFAEAIRQGWQFQGTDGKERLRLASNLSVESRVAEFYSLGAAEALHAAALF